jgi:hypothetical protein
VRAVTCGLGGARSPGRYTRRGVERGAPEISYCGPGDAGKNYPEGSRFFCHYHPIGRTFDSHSFFGPAQDVRIGNEVCLQYE